MKGVAGDFYSDWGKHMLLKCARYSLKLGRVKSVIAVLLLIALHYQYIYASLGKSSISARHVPFNWK